jgi:hypothetical protein
VVQWLGWSGLGARHCDKGMRAADWPICAGQVKGSSKSPAAERQLSLISSHWPRLLGFGFETPAEDSNVDFFSPLLFSSLLFYPLISLSIVSSSLCSSGPRIYLLSYCTYVGMVLQHARSPLFPKKNCMSCPLESCDSLYF